MTKPPSGSRRPGAGRIGTGTGTDGTEPAGPGGGGRAALSGAGKQLGDTKGCAEVSTFNDVIGPDADGVPTSSDHPAASTSPTRAYALSPNVKDSAP
ncbi:hypothetical protein [Actinacidiphila sp. ITFR-21]|uniref:hypothetical protein n=1 Tax=Actinacidiphila sp. ITFR-21 TaxID=3075199 RepID=UPI00288C3421|nr:hypothetical protein [Streptomyces sp. ITFR-21]WNI17073.1 hypothetical protein RLT57_17145 [Streptomyces sp. ITFR-21]